MKIILIIPPAPLLNEPTVYPPLGLLYIGAILEKEGHRVKICDLRENSNLNLIPKGDLYGVTATTTEAEDAKKIGKYLSKRDGNSVIGGAHASNLPEDFLGYYDNIIVGDGEKTILDLIANGNKGIIYGESIKNIDSIPFPARHLMKDNRIVTKSVWGGYGFIYDEDPIATTIITSRGCPYNCAFCANIPQSVRFHSTEYVANEIKFLIERYNCRHFDLLDDHFTMNKKRLRELTLVFESLHILFRCQARVDALNDEICEMLVRMGCKEVNLGIETADDSILKLMNKGITVNQSKKAIEILKEYNIGVKLFLMAGLPGETWETIEKTKQFVIDTQPDKAPVTLFIPFPSCDIWKNPEKYGVRIITRDFSKYFFRYPSKSVIETDFCSSEELTEHFNHLRDFILSNKWRIKNA